MPSKIYLKFIILYFFLFSPETTIKSQDVSDFFPDNHFELTEPIGYDKYQKFLKSVSQYSFIEVTEEGVTVEGRRLYLVHIFRGNQKSKWRVFFIAQQHGNEPAGKDALIYLIYYISKNPGLLPEEVELWLLPMANPDGAEANKRRNGNNFDLNRDHQLLSQPESRTIHKVFRRIMPHVFADCHEFERNSKDYDDKGWLEWPQIMMDCANNPLFDQDVLKNGIRWCKDVKNIMNRKGHNYSRYYLGGVPPDDELRHSTPEVDDARNGLGAYGGFSFIIESGIKRGINDTNEDLGRRVDAYLDLLQQFLRNTKHRDEDIRAINQSRYNPLPDFIPTNYFWANASLKVTDIKVIEKSTGQVKTIKTANFMHDLIIKNSVPLPVGYIIPTEFADPFLSLFKLHSIHYNILQKSKKYKVESCRILKFEDFEDDVYKRYENRQIVKRDLPVIKEFDVGSIEVILEKISGRRTILLLEPAQIYGLYQYSQFHKIITEQNLLPVWRIVE